MIKHLYEYDQDREAQVIRRLFVDGAPGASMQMLGIPGWHWLAVHLPSHRLGRARSRKVKPGDVDICGGLLVPTSQQDVDAALDEAAAMEERNSKRPLSPQMEEVRARDPEQWERGRANTRHLLTERILLSRGHLKPSLGTLFAFEVKVTWFSTDGVLKASKVGSHPQKMARKQARGLAEMGFDHVGLLRILVTEPCPHPDGSAWLHAGSHARAGVREYERAILAEHEDPFATLIVSVGAVDGRLENEAGSMSVNMFPVGQWKNPLGGAEADGVRETLRAHLRPALCKVPGPRLTPMLVLACADDACGSIFVPSDEIAERWDAPCPDCGGPTTAGGSTGESPR